MVLTNPRALTSPIVSTTGTLTAASQIAFDDSGATGVLIGVANSQIAFRRFDATGIGAPLVTYTGTFDASASNINTWFNNRQLVRLRCVSRGGSPVGSLAFTLPGASALNTAFDALVSLGLSERLQFVIEYTGEGTSFVTILPRGGVGNPVITGTTSITVRQGVQATLEITRSGGVISDFLFTNISAIGTSAALLEGALVFINPSTAVWDASTNGPLPTNGVAKGSAYRIINAPADGSGRFNTLMENGDYAVWTAESFTQWSDTDNWFVLAANEVRRITALEEDFLQDVQLSPEGDRNTVLRGANYADSAGEIRLKLYTQRSDYSAGDLNTTGDIDEYTDPSDGTGFLGIRFSGQQASLVDVLPTLYVYSEDSNGNFTRLLNLQEDFSFQGDFGAESDYLSQVQLNYNANDTWRIYVGTLLDRYNAPNLDINEENLSDSVQAKLNRTNGPGNVDEQRLTTLENRVDILSPLSTDVTDLDGWAGIYNTANDTQTVTITRGYSLLADYRGASTRYESAGVTYDDTGTDVIRYTGLGDSLYKTMGFKVASVDEVTLTGGTGTANINVDGTNYLATFDTDLTTTASNFVTTHTAALTTAGITVTSNGAVLSFTATTGPKNFITLAPVNVSGGLGGTLDNGIKDQVLLWVIDGTERIPYLRMVSAGNYQINHYTPSRTEDQAVSNQFSRSTVSGAATLRPGTTDTTTITIGNFPANTTIKTRRSISVNLSVFVNGSDTLAGHDEAFEVPVENVVETIDNITTDINLGPLYGNRVVRITMSYTLRVVGDDLLLDLQLVSAPSDVTIRPNSQTTFLSYTAPNVISRLDDWETIQSLSGNYTFDRENELLLTFHSFVNLNLLEAVSAAINASGTVEELNDIDTPIPHENFATVEIPDRSVLSGFEFRTFTPSHFLRHGDLDPLLRNRATQWVYGLAELRDVTEHAVTSLVDFTQGVVLLSPNGTRYTLTIANDGTLKTDPTA